MLTDTQLGIKRVVGHRELLAAADEQADAVVVLGDRGHADHLGELAHRFVARVQQIVGHGPGGFRLGDGIVVLGHALAEIVHLRGQGTQLLVDQAVLLVQLVVEGIEGLAQALRLGQHRLARLGRGRVLRSGLQGGKETLHRRADPGGVIRQQRVELVDLAQESVQLAVLAGGVAQLAGEEVAGQAAHVDDLAARAHVAGTAELRDPGLLDGILAAVARRLDVGDVVPGDSQPGLAGAEAGQAYRE